MIPINSWDNKVWIFILVALSWVSSEFIFRVNDLLKLPYNIPYQIWPSFERKFFFEVKFSSYCNIVKWNFGLIIWLKEVEGLVLAVWVWIWNWRGFFHWHLKRVLQLLWVRWWVRSFLWRYCNMSWVLPQKRTFFQMKVKFDKECYTVILANDSLEIWIQKNLSSMQSGWEFKPYCLPYLLV